MRREAFLAACGGAALSAFVPQAARASLFDRVERIARAMPGMLGVTCRTLGDARPVFAFNARTEFPAASTIKLVILATAFATQERRPGSLDEWIVTRRRDLIAGSDFMAQQPDGARFRVRDLLVPMIDVSDNTASNYLISHYGFDALNATAARAGMTRTRLARHFLDFRAIVHHNDNVTTPEDMARLLYLIAHAAREGESTIVTPEHARRMLAIMLHQTDRDAIPAGLPHGTQVANKTGELDGTRNDVAVVEPFADSPYILAIYTKWVREDEAAYHAIHRLARLSFALLGESNQ